MITPFRNKDGKPVDWWLTYKLPIDIGPGQQTTGFEFLYTDSEAPGTLALSSIRMDHEETALGRTLKQLNAPGSGTGYILWNDEIPPSPATPNPKNKGNLGHSKGVLAFNKKANTGFYLLHSTPRFPLVGEGSLPEDERKFGQTYLCIHLKDYRTVNQIAAVLHTQNQVQVYDSHLPDATEDEAVYQLAHNTPVETPDKPAVLEFESKQGATFLLIAKNRHWSQPKKGKALGLDFWKDLVGPTLKCDIDVETWRRGTVFGDLDDGIKKKTMDVVDVDLAPIGLEGYRWAFSKDHAKWGVSCDKTRYVIIADINRQVSQERRGGGGIVFRQPDLWATLKKICVQEKKVEAGPHKDQA